LERELEILELSQERIVIASRGFSVPLMNAVRRLSLSDVPSMAVDFAYFYDNNTGIHDEIIAHRLGLLVLRSDTALGKYKEPEECRGAEPPNPDCFVDLYLEKEVREGEPGVYVKASDISSSDPDVKPAHPETPIAYLAPGQRIQVVAYARLGRGKEHAKWSPASIASLKYSTIVEIHSGKLSEECVRCLEAYPEVIKGAVEGRREVELPYSKNAGGLLYCEEASCSGEIRVRFDSSRLFLIVESTGALSPERIVYEAIRELQGKIEKLIQAIREGG
jgi:DNA-directed RNA polymerase subunit D